MIRLTRLNDKELVVNAELIEFVEASPDTIISMVSGKKIMVTESVEQVIERVVEYRNRCHQVMASSVR